MSGQLGSKQNDFLWLAGQRISASVAGTSAAILVYMRDNDGHILLATGTDVPSDATGGYAKGCTFIDTNVAAGTVGHYVNVGSTTSCNFDAAANILSGDVSVTGAGVSTVATVGGATAAEVAQASDISAQNTQMVPSSVITASATAIKQSVVKHGDIIHTTIFIDLQGLKSVATAGDIIGDTGVSYIGRVTAAINGTIFKGVINCAEVPTTGDDDIDLYAATEATGAYDAAISGLTATALVNAGGAHAIGTAKNFTAMPAANAYLYLTSGNGDTAGTYAAGQISIEMWGYV